MWLTCSKLLHRTRYTHTIYSLLNFTIDKKFVRVLSHSSQALRDDNKETGKMTLAKDLAFLVEESCISNETEKAKRNRNEIKRFLELRIKKKVKEQYKDGKYHELMSLVIANPNTLQDAYDCIRLTSNIDLASSKGDDLPFQSIADELRCGKFNVGENTYTISTRGRIKDSLVLPNLKLRVVQEAIRIVLEIVFRPHFSKISHGCRNGRGHLSALRYIRKDIHNPDYWFSLGLNTKLDLNIVNKIVSCMESKIKDLSLCDMIRVMFDAQVLMFQFGEFPKGHGLPQEGILSPILFNIYLDQFDHEFYKLSMKYEALDSISEKDGLKSKLRSWFRTQIDKNDVKLKIHCVRVLDEIFVAISGSKEVSHMLRDDILSYLNNSLLLKCNDETDPIPCNGPHGVRFLGTLIKRMPKDTPAIRAVHKLKDKINLFASQKNEAWNEGTLRIGKKWLAHGLKKVKESEIKHLVDSNSLLTQVSRFRKPGMKTDHWYKILLKTWMKKINAKNEEFLLCKHVTEPSLPQELRESFYEFQKQAEKYVSTETASIIALSHNTKSVYETQIIAPINVIKKRLNRYGLTNLQGYSRPCHMLILHDENHIIDWFSGIASRWIRWYSECENFNEVKEMIFNEVRMSCIRTLAGKYRIHEIEIEKKFDIQLSKITCSSEEVMNYDEGLMYGILYSGICLLSLARIVSVSRPCNCFVMGCVEAAPYVYTLNVMERQKFPGWKTGFASCIHPSLQRRRIGLCKKHVEDLFLGYISLQSIDFGSWR